MGGSYRRGHIESQRIYDPLPSYTLVDAGVMTPRFKGTPSF
jgi:hypothetical protein